MHKPSLPRRVSLFGLILVVGLASGCTSLNFMGDKQAAVNLPVSSDVYRVEMYSNHGEPKTYDGYLNSDPAGEPVTVQTALEASGAVGRYRNMEVTLYRRVAESGQLLKLPVAFRPRTDSVKVEQDYALHPGDRIVIKPVSKGLFSLVMSGVSDKGFD
jgi:hypothetical protein